MSVHQQVETGRPMRDFDGTARHVHKAFLKDEARMAVLGFTVADSGREWDLPAFTHHLDMMLNGNDHATAARILTALQTEYPDVAIDVTWLKHLRSAQGGTDAAALLYAAMKGESIKLANIDGRNRGANIDISFIGGQLIIDLWIGERIRYDNNGEIGFEAMPDSILFALPGRTLSSILDDDLLKPFEQSIYRSDKGGTLGSYAMVDMPMDIVRMKDLGPEDVAPIHGAFGS